MSIHQNQIPVGVSIMAHRILQDKIGDPHPLVYL